MYSKLRILQKQSAAAVIVLALELIMIFKHVEAFRIVTFNLAAIAAFTLWVELLIIQVQEEEAKKNKSIQPPIRSSRDSRG